jgi:Flp pilus assembly protein TadD
MEEAAEQLLRAATLQPNAARLHFNLGLVLQHLGRLEQATVPLSRAAELAPDDPSTLHALADNLARRGRLATSPRRRTRPHRGHPDYPAGPAMLQALGG